MNQNKLIKLIYDALNNIKHNENFGIEDKNLIINSIPEDWLLYFNKRYKLNLNVEENFTSDDLRQLIIGAFSQNDEKLRLSDFGIALLAAGSEILREANDEPAENFHQITRRLAQANYFNELKSFSKQKLFKIWFNVLDFLSGTILPRWTTFFVSLINRKKFHKNLKRDLDRIKFQANLQKQPRDLTSQFNNQPPEQKEFIFTQCQNEAIFHNLAYFSVKDKSEFTVPDLDNNLHTYITHKLFKEDGIVCYVLIPKDTEKRPIDIKLIFRGTHNVMSAIINSECNGAGSDTFKKHSPKILSELNNLISSKNLPEKDIKLSLGGHSLGGALAMHCLRNLTLNKLNSNNSHEYDDAIKQQFEYEKDEKFNNAFHKKNLSEQQILENRSVQLKKALDKFNDSHRNNLNALAKIQNIELITFNSPGVNNKSREIFCDSLNFIKKHNPEFKVTANHVIANGDLVQKAGQALITAGLRRKIIDSRVVKIKTTGLEGIQKRLAICAICVNIIDYLVTSKFFINLGAALKNLLKLIPEGTTIRRHTEFFTKMLDFKNSFKFAFGIMKKAHINYNFQNLSQKPIEYEILDNRNKDRHVLETQEISNRLNIETSSIFKLVKKRLSSLLKEIYKHYKQLKIDFKPITKYLDNTRHIIIQKFEDRLLPTITPTPRPRS